MHMEMRLLFVFATFTHSHGAYSMTASISGKISQDITFLHKMFPVPPSKRAIIEVHLSYTISSVRMQGNQPIMGIYATKDDVNIKKQCPHTERSQMQRLIDKSISRCSWPFGPKRNILSGHLKNSSQLFD